MCVHHTVITIANTIVCGGIKLTYSLPPSQNSVRHNLSLHSRFVKVQNDSSGKSSWWTVNLDAKSTRGRRRSSSVDNGNAPSPKAKKKNDKKKLKKVKCTASSSDICTSSPCDSPTTTAFLPGPWSPSPLIDCPSPTGSDRSATYSPIAYSPVLHRHSRNVTPVSPLVSPPGLEGTESVFSSSNSPLMDSYSELHHSSSDHANDSSQQFIDSLASLNLRSSRDGMGSSSSLSSLNSPRVQQLKGQQHPVFNFTLPNAAYGPDSSGYSSSCVSDTDASHNVTEATAPPTYEDHISQTIPSMPHRPTSYTPTRHHSHQLHFCMAAEQGRPRSESEPSMHRLPPDIDPSLLSSEFKDCNIEDILRTEMQYGGGLIGRHQSSLIHSHVPQPMPNDPTLTSAALPMGSPIQVHRQLNAARW